MTTADEVGLFSIDGAAVSDVTAAFAGLVGLPAIELSGREVRDLVHPEDRDELDRALAVLQPGAPVDGESRFLHQDGSVIYVRWVARPEALGDRWSVAATDTADLVKLLAQRDDLQTRLELAIGQTTVAMWDLDVQTGVLAWEPQAAEIFGVDVDALPDSAEALLEHVDVADRDALQRAFRTLADAGSAEVALRVGEAHERRHLSLRGRTLRTGRAATGRSVGLLLDITAEKALEEQLLRMSISDGLTGILNRRGFDQLLRGETKRCAQAGQPLSVLMVDVDHFKPFNDTYGHLVGDQALITIARTLRRRAGEHGQRLARYGGEEFALVAPGVGAADAEALAEALRVAVTGVVLRQAPGEAFSVSVGVATAAEDEPGAALLARADRALYAAKRGGRDRVAAG